MKCWIWRILLGVVCTGAWADDAYRDFTDTKGRSIRGRVISYDAAKGVVQIEAESGKKAPIPLEGLIEKDQEYVWAWENAQGFADEKLFRISCAEKQIEETKEEIRQDLTWASGDTDKDFLMNVITRKRIAYDFKLGNFNATPLSGIRMEYKIYYEQSEMTRDRSKPIAEQKNLNETVALDAIPAKESITFQTKPVEIHEDDINEIDSRTGDPRQAGKGRVHGIRARFYMTLTTGDQIMREICEPSSLSLETCPW
jgi:hypothetical protein